MGLDSVELLVEFENYFGIAIPDREAEKIFTVQNMVDTIAKYRCITGNDTSLEKRVFQHIADSINQRGMKLTDKISVYISPDDAANWASFKNNFWLEVPIPETGSSRKNKIRDIFSRTPFYDWPAITVEQFIAVVCAHNFRTLTDRNNITSKYEIYIIVMAITADATGVDYYEITPDKSFTNDLGLD